MQEEFVTFYQIKCIETCAYIVAASNFHLNASAKSLSTMLLIKLNIKKDEKQSTQYI